MIRIAASIVWTIALALPALAASEVDIRKGLARCAIIQGDLDRLTCVDALARQAGLDRPQPLPAASGDVGKWIVKRDKNPIDDTERVTLVLESDTGRGRLNRPVVFVARCQSEKTEVYINWNAYVGDDSGSAYGDWKYVTIRVGSDTAEQQRWDIATSRDATFAPDWPGNLLKRMAGTDQFIAQLTPYGESPITATFKTTGLATGLQNIKSACKWSDQEAVQSGWEAK